MYLFLGSFWFILSSEKCLRFIPSKILAGEAEEHVISYCTLKLSMLVPWEHYGCYWITWYMYHHIWHKQTSIKSNNNQRSSPGRGLWTGFYWRKYCIKFWWGWLCPFMDASSRIKMTEYHRICALFMYIFSFSFVLLAINWAGKMHSWILSLILKVLSWE